MTNVRMQPATLAAALCFTLTLLAGVASADRIVATFEAYGEGFAGTTLTESPSGFVFRDGVYSFGPTGITIEHGASPLVPPVIPGNVITGGGFSPGPVVGLGFNFGFTVDFPQPSRQFELDVLYGSQGDGLVSIVGYSGAGVQVAEANIVLPSTFPQGLTVVHGTLLSPAAAAPMARAVIRSGGSHGVGYDNIAIPEPAGVLAAAAISLPLLLRRRLRRATTTLPAGHNEEDMRGSDPFLTLTPF